MAALYPRLGNRRHIFRAGTPNHQLKFIWFRNIIAPDGHRRTLEPIPDPLQDFLYEDEMRPAFEAAGVTRLFSAFSREPGKPKTYVQQAIKNHSAEVWHLLQEEAVVFVCGEASRMAPDVRLAFAEVFQEHTATTAADAQAWLTGLVASHRYLEDIWASAT